jgi:hypothetical protein
MVRKLASVVVAAAIASVGFVGAAGGASASAKDPGTGGPTCVAYNVYSQKSASTITISYRMACGATQLGLSLEGYSNRGSATVCGRYATGTQTNYLATPSCSISDPAGSQRFQHAAFARINAKTVDVAGDSYYS